MSPLARARRFGAWLARAAMLYALVATASAAEPQWLKLQGPSFGVISQLDENETLAWAVEFDQFIGALHSLYSVDQVALPPLTIVLFRQPRDFAPYRLRTESGQASVAGFFGNTGDWSVIGMPSGGRDGYTRETIYHEAVHWFTTASEHQQPLWFAEGLAEALSTFTIVDGRGRWGQAIEDNVAYLSSEGLLPMEELLRTSQDDALHGGNSDKYYPQAWAFVHYLMFGNGGANRSKLGVFLKELEHTDLDTAVEAAFGRSYDGLTKDLRRYLERGRYAYAEVPLHDRGAQMSVEPASAANVAFALGRLATVGGNIELARSHADEVIALRPAAAAGYELAAYAAHESGDDESVAVAIDAAIERGSSESWIYATKADRMLIESERDAGQLDERLPADTARAAADLYERALGLRPRNEDAFAGLVTALLNVDVRTDADDAALRAGRMLFPTNGWLLVGQAAAAKDRGDTSAALEMLDEATVAPFTMPRRYRNAVVALRTRWFGDWFLDELSALTEAGRFAESRALVTRHLQDDRIKGPVRAMLEALDADLPDLERLHAATEAGRAGKADEAAAILTALVNDPNTGERTRREAERMLKPRPATAAATP